MIAREGSYCEGNNRGDVMHRHHPEARETGIGFFGELRHERPCFITPSIDL